MNESSMVDVTLLRRSRFSQRRRLLREALTRGDEAQQASPDLAASGVGMVAFETEVFGIGARLNLVLPIITEQIVDDVVVDDKLTIDRVLLRFARRYRHHGGMRRLRLRLAVAELNGSCRGALQSGVACLVRSASKSTKRSPCTTT